MVNVHGGATVALVVAVLLVLLVVLGVLAALALVLRGSKPSDRAELVRTVAELVRACHPGRGGFASTGGSSGTDQDKHDPGGSAAGAQSRAEAGTITVATV